jgi:hypothetical protein
MKEPFVKPSISRSHVAKSKYPVDNFFTYLTQSLVPDTRGGGWKLRLKWTALLYIHWLFLVASEHYKGRMSINIQTKPLLLNLSCKERRHQTPILTGEIKEPAWVKHGTRCQYFRELSVLLPLHENVLFHNFGITNPWQVPSLHFIPFREFLRCFGSPKLELLRKAKVWDEETFARYCSKYYVGFWAMTK